MNNISKAFQGRKALIPFVTCGDPSMEATAAIIDGAAANGADMLVLGIPFSDPTAEGPEIQAASARALASGVTTDRVFDMVRGRNAGIPLLIMTYANVVFRYGAEKFAAACRDCGVSGVILHDLPYEERDEFQDAFEAAGVELVVTASLVYAERAAMVAQAAKSMVLFLDGECAKVAVKAFREAVQVPCAGVITGCDPEEIQAAGALTDGLLMQTVIVGLDAEAAGEKIRTLREALNQVK